MSQLMLFGLNNSSYGKCMWWPHSRHQFDLLLTQGCSPFVTRTEKPKSRLHEGIHQPFRTILNRWQKNGAAAAAEFTFGSYPRGGGVKKWTLLVLTASIHSSAELPPYFFLESWHFSGMHAKHFGDQIWGKTSQISGNIRQISCKMNQIFGKMSQILGKVS